MFHSIFNSLAMSRYLSFFSYSFRFIQWSAGTAKSTILQLLFLCWLLIRLVFWPRLGDPCVCQSPIRVYVCYFLGQILGCAFTICLYSQIKISYTSPSGPPCRPSRVKSYIHSALICYFVASYLFSLWYDWSLRRCFVLLFGEILFPLKVSFSLPCPGFVVWDVVY